MVCTNAESAGVIVLGRIRTHELNGILFIERKIDIALNEQAAREISAESLSASFGNFAVQILAAPEQRLTRLVIHREARIPRVHGGDPGWIHSCDLTAHLV